MSSIIKVDNIQNQSGANIIKEDSNTITLGASGDTIALASGASQSGFGRTGTVDWQTGSIKTSTFTAANGEGYFANTSGGAFVMNLPAGTAGNIVSVVDYTNTFQTNALTITPNGSQKIGGVAASIDLNTEGQSVTFVYVDDTEGWKNVQDSTSNVQGGTFLTATGGTITTSGDFKIHTFTGPGTFTVCSVGNPPDANLVEYTVVAGGGGGGSNGGGGGAGGFRFASPSISPLTYPAKPLAAPAGIPVTAQGYSIVVGGGGNSTTFGTGTSTSGSNSSFSTIVSAGGGHAGSSPSPFPGAGASGGSGGGGGGASKSGGAGNTPPVSPSQGNNGGNSSSGNANYGGGGGALAVGTNATDPSPGGAGGVGAGLPTAFGSNGQPSGSFRFYAGGGGGGTNVSPGGPPGGPGGTGGGGPGSLQEGTGVAGTTNTGGGGGGGAGGSSPGSGAGGSGIVIIRYKFQ